MLEQLTSGVAISVDLYGTLATQQESSEEEDMPSARSKASDNFSCSVYQAANTMMKKRKVRD